MSGFDMSDEWPIDEAFAAEEEYDQQIAADYEEAPSSALQAGLAEDPSWDAEENQIAAELDDNAESNLDNTLEQAQSFDDILNSN